MDPGELKFEYTGNVTGKFNLYLYEDGVIFCLLHKCFAMRMERFEFIIEYIIDLCICEKLIIIIIL